MVLYNQELPYTPRLVTRLFSCLMGVTAVRGPRPLLRLFATTCRYRSARPLILQALLATLANDSRQLRLSLNTLSSLMPPQPLLLSRYFNTPSHHRHTLVT